MNKNIIRIFIIVLLLDQFSKSFITSFMELEESILILPFFDLSYIHNYGVAFGMFDHQLPIIMITTAIAAVLIYKFAFSFKRNMRNDIAFGFLIGGMMGNLIDRIFYGYVIDFLDFDIFGYDFAVFNLADTFVVIGCLLLMYAIIKGEDTNGNKSKREREN